MVSVLAKLKIKIAENPPLLLLVVYASVILVSTVVLMLPVSTQDGRATHFIDAFFTSASAFCVTGLVVEPTYAYWSLFGQCFILLVIQLGGLGVMTIVAFIGILTNQKLEGSQRRIMQEATNSPYLGDLSKLIIFILKSTFLIEGIGVVLLAFSFVPIFGFVRGIWYAVFHSISAYCNAGFDVLGDESLCAYNSHHGMLLTIAALIIIAGLGFRVYIDVLKTRHLKTLRLHSKIVLVSTAVLIAGGTLLFLLTEWSNPETIGDMSIGDKIIQAFFQSVTPRTAGFAAIDQAKLTHASAFATIILMFIGGSPAGTAGGVKTTTLVTLFALLRSLLRNKDEIVIFKRRLSTDIVKKSAVIFFISLLWCLIVSFFLMIFEKNIPPLDLMFEAFSAFATAGLTRGITADLHTVSKVLISMTMLFGKVGILGMVFAFARTKRKVNFHEAEEKIIIG